LLQHGHCQPTARPRDIVLLIDGSEAMSGDKIEGARGAGRTFLNALDLGRDRVAVLRYSAEARLMQGMSDDRARLVAALDSLAAGSGSRLDLGLWAALEILSGPALRDDAAPVILLLTAGRPELGREPALREAARLGRAIGVSIEIVGFGDDLPLALLGDIAGAPSRLYRAQNAGDLAARFVEIAGRAPCP
jgi:Mg-chelatase subunit ChlD